MPEKDLRYRTAQIALLAGFTVPQLVGLASCSNSEKDKDFLQTPFPTVTAYISKGKTPTPDLQATIDAQATTIAKQNSALDSSSKPTQTPTIIPKLKETPTLPGIEKSKLEWQRFRSPNLPYQVDIPADWTVRDWSDSDLFEHEHNGTKETIMIGTYGVSVNPESTVNNYGNNLLEAVENYPDVERIYTIDTGDRVMMNDLKEQNRPFYNLVTTKVAGQETYILRYYQRMVEKLRNDVNEKLLEIFRIDVLFIEDGKLWTIIYNNIRSSEQILSPEEYIETYNILGEVMKSFSPTPVLPTIPIPTITPQRSSPTVKPKETPTSIAEKPKQGWQNFQSINFSYKMDYPSAWTAQSINKGLPPLWIIHNIDEAQIPSDLFLNQSNKKADMEQEGIRISVIEPPKQGNTLEAYVNNRFTALTRSFSQAYKLDEAVLKELREKNPPLYNLVTTKVARQETRFLMAENPGEMLEIDALFINKDRLWTVNYRWNSSKGFPSYDTFREMLKSFSFR